MKAIRAKRTKPEPYAVEVTCDIEGRLHEVFVRRPRTAKGRWIVARNLNRDEADALATALRAVADRLHI